jgi:hypothetical protein
MDHRHATASVYLRQGVFLIASGSYLGCGDGGSVLNGWVVTDSAAIDDEALGKAVRAAWTASECNVPMPDFSRPFPALHAVLDAAQAENERQFAKGNALLGVDLKGELIELLPTRNDGCGGFDHLPALIEKIDTEVDDDTLGHYVRKTLARCR